MYGSMEESPPAAAPALGPEEVKFVRKLMATNGDDAQSAGLSDEPQDSSISSLPTLPTQALSTSTLAKLEAASDEVELQQSVYGRRSTVSREIPRRLFISYRCVLPRAVRRMHFSVVWKRQSFMQRDR